MRPPINPVLLFSLWLLSAQSPALVTDKDQPIELAADSVEVDDGKGLSLYKGNVDLRQGTVRLWADQVTIEHRGEKPDKIIAVGSPARFFQQTEDGPIKAHAKHAHYVVNNELLTLTGDAMLIQNRDEIRNDRIIYDRARHQIKAGDAAKGKQRVHITIQPPE
jgi:lipopolysaccharide export system protein LptA